MSQGYVIHSWIGGKKKGCPHTPDPESLKAGVLRCRCGARPLGIIEPRPQRFTAKCFDLEQIILGLPLDRPPMPDEEVQVLTDSLAAFLIKLQNQRDQARERVKLLERECDGLRLALKRGGGA